ncbi:FadR/GntR family transcriptional regulator [Paenibacillus senegalensis]|uniref:FadR/GntR family transcriptional regulator n=1 Tax=Paenibacillus senegalensis TaxID=1465766 RepID=UPI0021CC3242|nr:FadR/GntR family transcriptional regulator [Paenibacillus senegalensis]
MKPQKSYEIVMNDLKSRIESGELLPGMRLPSVVDLAITYGVGRSTLREALSALKAMGWLEIRQGGGTFVCTELPAEPAGDEGAASLFHQTQSLKELMEIRKLLETGSASLAARNRTEEDLRRLEDIVHKMRTVVHDDGAGEEADVEFHLLVARASHNTLLFQMMESLHDKLQESIKETRKLWFYGERAAAERLAAEHLDIYEAIRLHDEERASSLMQSHLEKVEKVLSKLF